MTLPDETQALLDEIQANYARARVAARRRVRREIVQEIGSGVGQVVVNGLGSFRSVKLNRDALLVVPEDVLARQIIDALAKAEQKATQHQEAK